MRKFWGRGASAAEANQQHPVKAALLKAMQRGEAGPAHGDAVGPWRRREDDPGTDDESVAEHPAGYIARIEGESDAGGDASGEGLVHAVNAALILGKPLLLTGNPGTGKSQLAERVAWEFNLGPVLRFEAQSLSEADDLYYRFDLVGRLAAVETFKAAVALNDLAPDRAAAAVGRHLSFGALGLAILRADPVQGEALRVMGLGEAVLDRGVETRASVVLIDEIDKTSRDFPNDLLNRIERKEFRLREMGDRLLRAPDDAALQPIVLITSNSERELPAPFLRRCVYFHIPDPGRQMLSRILRSRVPRVDNGRGGLHPLYEDVLDFFEQYQKAAQAVGAYRAGASELQDLARAMAVQPGLDASQRLSNRDNQGALRRATAALLKHPSDIDRLKTLLRQWKVG